MDTAAQELTARLAADYDAALPRIVGSLGQFLARLEHEGASVFYDPEDGGCVLMAGDVVPSAAVEVDDAYWLLIDPENNAVIGLEFPSLPVFLQAHPELAPQLTELVAPATQQPGAYVRVQPQQAGTIAPKLRALVCAE